MANWTFYLVWGAALLMAMTAAFLRSILDLACLCGLVTTAPVPANSIEFSVSGFAAAT
jgi:hypothetical protein